MNDFGVFLEDCFTVTEEERERKKYEKIAKKLRIYMEDLENNYPQELANEVGNAKGLLSGEYDLSGEPYELFMDKLGEWVNKYERIINQYNRVIENVKNNIIIAESKAEEWRRLEDIAEGRIN